MDTYAYMEIEPGMGLRDDHKRTWQKKHDKDI